MEAPNMADTISPPANETLLKYLTKEVEKMALISEENEILKSKVNSYELNEICHVSLKKQVTELKKELSLRKELSKTWKEDQKRFFEQEKHLNQLTKENEYLKKQLPYKHQCFQLRQKNKDLEYALNWQKNEQSWTIRCLEQEVEKHQQQINKLQEEKEKLQLEKKQLQDKETQLNKNVTDIQKENSELEEEMRHLKKEKNKLIVEKRSILRSEVTQKEKLLVMDQMYSDLENQLEQMVSDLDHGLPYIFINVNTDKPFGIAKMHETNLELKGTLDAMRKKLERKDRIISAKKKEYEELKQSTSKLLPPEEFESKSNARYQKCQFVIRDLRKMVKALMGQYKMSQALIEEHKNVNGQLGEKVANNTKAYLIEKKWNYDLSGALTKSGVKVPEHKPSAFQVPASPNVHMLSRERQVQNKIQTLEAAPAFLPPISKKLLPELGIKPYATISKKKLYNSRENLDLRLPNVTDESQKKVRYVLVPSIPSNSLQSSKCQEKIFMTETSFPNRN